VGNVDVFRKEFEQDVLVIRHAIEEFGMKKELKLSVHSGSDKFSIYPVIKEVIEKYNAGLHLKTAGTTWLEELIGLAEAGGRALDFCKEVYAGSQDRYTELAGPYSTVIDIHKEKLPTAEEVNNWKGEMFANSLRHIEGHGNYNPHLRQLLHVAYKLAAEKGDVYMKLLDEHREIVGRNVTENLYERHIKPLFLG
jgi:tagaturonate epimerase